MKKTSTARCICAIFNISPGSIFEARRVDCINSMVVSIVEKIRSGRMKLDERLELYRNLAKTEVPNDIEKRIISIESIFICLFAQGLYCENRLDHNGIPIAYRWGPITVEKIPIPGHPFSDQNVAVLSNLVKYVISQLYVKPKPI